MSNIEENRKKYFERLLESCSSESQKIDFIKEAYKVALDTRKFEIELYWKRATYFWAFIAAIFIAYIAITNNKGSKELLAAVALMGLFFSLGWHFVARGSKVWQENWEVHISYLEEEIHGPLFKTYGLPSIDHKFVHLTKEYPFSVSKVNQILSLYTCFFWLVLFSFSLVQLFPPKLKECLTYCLNVDWQDSYLPLLLLLLSFVIGVYKLYKHSYSFHVNLLKAPDLTRGINYYFEKRERYQSVIDQEKLKKEKGE